jgi:hypothetical protein
MVTPKYRHVEPKCPTLKPKCPTVKPKCPSFIGHSVLLSFVFNNLVASRVNFFSSAHLPVLGELGKARRESGNSKVKGRVRFPISNFPFRTHGRRRAGDLQPSSITCWNGLAKIDPELENEWGEELAHRAATMAHHDRV